MIFECFWREYDDLFRNDYGNFAASVGCGVGTGVSFSESVHKRSEKRIKESPALHFVWQGIHLFLWIGRADRIAKKEMRILFGALPILRPHVF